MTEAVVSGELTVRPGRLSGVLLIQPVVHRDARGSFHEAFRARDYAALGLPEFVQDNVAFSQYGVLRGLHFQRPNPQGKLVSVLAGAVFDVIVDLRADSATFGQWEANQLRADDHLQLYVPPGFAHGYQVISESALVTYRCTDYYDRACDRTLSWEDPALNIPWPIQPPVCSEKDRRGLRLADVRSEKGSQRIASG